MTPATLRSVRRAAYRGAALLALVYVAYVLGLKFANRVSAGPLGDVGEFLLVLACVTAFAVGLFVDEAQRGHDAEARGGTP